MLGKLQPQKKKTVIRKGIGALTEAYTAKADMPSMSIYYRLQNKNDASNPFYAYSEELEYSDIGISDIGIPAALQNGLDFTETPGA